MKIFAIIVSVILICGFAALIVYELIQLIKTIKVRVRDKKDKQKEKQHEKGNEK